jgi:hypothetical protein
MPSGNMFLGALSLGSFFDSSWGAVGAAEVRAGAMMSINVVYYSGLGRLVNGRSWPVNADKD